LANGQPAVLDVRIARPAASWSVRHQPCTRPFACAREMSHKMTSWGACDEGSRRWI